MRINNINVEQKTIENMKENFSISFDWEVKTAEDTERVGAMYCFKRCDVNQN